MLVAQVCFPHIVSFIVGDVLHFRKCHPWRCLNGSTVLDGWQERHPTCKILLWQSLKRSSRDLALHVLSKRENKTFPCCLLCTKETYQIYYSIWAKGRLHCVKQSRRFNDNMKKWDFLNHALGHYEGSGMPMREVWQSWCMGAVLARCHQWLTWVAMGLNPGFCCESQCLLLVKHIENKW